MEECTEAIVFSHGLNEIVKILGAHVDFVGEIIDEVAGSIGGSGKELASANFIRVTIDKIAVAVIQITEKVESVVWQIFVVAVERPDGDTVGDILTVGVGNFEVVWKLAVAIEVVKEKISARDKAGIGVDLGWEILINSKINFFIGFGF